MMTLRFTVIAPALALFAACSGSDGGGGNPAPQPPQQPAPPSVSAAGVWQITETVTNATGVCAGEIGTVEQYQVTVTQNGNALTVDTPVGRFSGTINGNVIQWTGSYPESGGTTTITSMSLTVTASSLSGSSGWTWQGGGQTCQGSTSISGTKTSPATIAPGEVTFVADALPDGRELAVLGTEDETGSPFLLTVLGDGDTTVPVEPGLHDFGVAALPADFDGDPASLEVTLWLPDVDVVPGQGSVVVLESPDGERDGEPRRP